MPLSTPRCCVGARHAAARCYSEEHAYMQRVKAHAARQSERCCGAMLAHAARRYREDPPALFRLSPATCRPPRQPKTFIRPTQRQKPIALRRRKQQVEQAESAPSRPFSRSAALCRFRQQQRCKTLFRHAALPPLPRC